MYNLRNEKENYKCLEEDKRGFTGTGWVQTTAGMTGYTPQIEYPIINRDSADYHEGLRKGYSDGYDEGYSAAKARYLFWFLLIAGIVFGSFMYYQIFK